MSRRRCDSRPDLTHILHTRRPSRRASGPGSCAGAGAEVGAACTVWSRSIDSPRQPAFWRFAGTGGGGGFRGACARTFARKSAS